MHTQTRYTENEKAGGRSPAQIICKGKFSSQMPQKEYSTLSYAQILPLAQPDLTDLSRHCMKPHHGRSALRHRHLLQFASCYLLEGPCPICSGPLGGQQIAISATGLIAPRQVPSTCVPSCIINGFLCTWQRLVPLETISVIEPAYA
jgi:hypothetical protein